MCLQHSNSMQFECLSSLKCIKFMDWDIYCFFYPKDTRLELFVLVYDGID